MKSLLVAPLLALLSCTGVRPAALPAERDLAAASTTPHLVPAGQAVAQVPEPGSHAQLGARGEVSTSRALPAAGAHDSLAVLGRVRAKLLEGDGAKRHSGALPLYSTSLPPPC